jgi:hypothetical protein
MNMSEHKQMFCKECGEEIVFDYTTPAKSFRMNESGQIERDDNNDACVEGDNPHLVFYCSDDREHEIGDSKELLIWIDAVTFDFYESGLYAR